ncbi:MAG: hypothetical protein AAF664_00695 [Planctomycetota bacterium]
MNDDLDLVETLIDQQTPKSELPTILKQLEQYDQRMYRESIFASVASEGVDKALAS